MICNKIGIIGAGAMGWGIAQVACASGCDVVLYDIDKKQLDQGIKSIHQILNRLADKGKLSPEEVVAALGQLHPVQSLGALADCDLVIEAIVENMDVKRKVFTELESIVADTCIIASNTSSLSITELSLACQNRVRFVGIHFFNPPGLMKLVEVVKGAYTSDKVVKDAIATVTSWGKIAVEATDSPGFIVNKVARPFYSEALRIYEEGTALPQDIDTSMTQVGGFKMGPFTLMDYIGHDVNYAVTESVWKSFYYDDRYTPSFAQKRLVQAGFLGKKSGRGFYDYSKDLPTSEISEAAQEYIFNRILCMLINEAADTVQRGICSESDIELAVQYGVNYPKGLLEWANEIGIDHVVQTLDNLYDRYHEARYRVSPYLRDRGLLYYGEED